MNELQGKNTLELEMLKKQLTGKERIKLMFQYFEEKEEEIISVKEVIESIKQEMIQMDERITKCEEISQQVAALENSLKDFQSKIELNVNEIGRVSKIPFGIFEWKVYLVIDSRTGFKFTSPRFFGITIPIEMGLVFTYARDHFEINLRVHDRNNSCDIIKWPLNLYIIIGILKEGGYLYWDYQYTDCSFVKPPKHGFSYLRNGLKFFYHDCFDELSNDRTDLTVQCFVNYNTN